jgi:hypothetical protein
MPASMMAISLSSFARNWLRIVQSSKRARRLPPHTHVFTMLVIAGSMPPRLNPNEVGSKKALCGFLWKAGGVSVLISDLRIDGKLRK